MNHSDHNYHHLLRQFEEIKRRGKQMTPLHFINGLESSPSHALILEVIAVDIELALTCGIKPSLQLYLSDFPYLSDEIPDLFVAVVDTFIKNFCPVRHCLGGLNSTAEYDIEGEIDRGGMGVVYQATQKSISRKVALKVLFLARDDIFNEARKVAVLNHPNICKVYDAGKIGEFPFMSMQLVRGKSLKKMQSQKRLSIPESISIVIQIADALAEAHRSNLVHFDVKPENIVVSVDGFASLMDFGLARKNSEISNDASRLQPFSPVYCAPEQLSLQFGERGARSDIYSLGLVLYELLAGRRAFNGNSAQIIDQLKHDPVRRLTDYDADISPKLEAICLKAIEKQPRNRFTSMMSFRDSLKMFALRSGVNNSSSAAEGD